MPICPHLACWVVAVVAVVLAEGEVFVGRDGRVGNGPEDVVFVHNKVECASARHCGAVVETAASGAALVPVAAAA